MEKETIKKIQDLVPEIMELKFGCRLKGYNEEYIIVDVWTNTKNEDWNYVITSIIDQSKFLEVRKKELTKYKILGHTIGLEDVLLAIKPYIGKTFRYQSNWLNLVSLWKLGKPFQDQSQKCKNFIGDLLLKD